MTDSPAVLLRQIENAFEGVTLEDGVTLHQTIVIDNYGCGDPLTEQIAGDERLDWRKLIDDRELQAVDGVGGMCFFDAKGFRFHLPAYLSAVAKNPECSIEESLLFQLTHLDDYQRKRFAILDTRQRKCVWAFLQHYRDWYVKHLFVYRPFEPEPDRCIKHIDEAIWNYWSKSS